MGPQPVDDATTGETKSAPSAAGAIEAFLARLGCVLAVRPLEVEHTPRRRSVG